MKQFKDPKKIEQLYSDLKIENKGNLFTGIFYTSFNSRNFELTSNVKFIDLKPENVLIDI